MNFLNIEITKLIAKITLLSYIGFGVLGFFHILNMENMAMTMDDCPFAHVLHNVSQGSMTGNLQMIELPLSTLISFLGLSFFAVALFSVFNKYLKITKIIFLYNFIQRKYKRLRYYFYQSLFSSGILNTKVF